MSFVGDFSPIEPDETDTFSFNITAELGTSTITSLTYTLISTIFGTTSDASPSSRLIGSPGYTTVNGVTVISQDVGGGSMVDGTIYRLEAMVVTGDSIPRTLMFYGHIPCVAAA